MNTPRSNTTLRSEQILAAFLFLMIAGCAGSRPGAPPHLLVETTRSGQAWPYGESGRGPVRHMEELSKEKRYGWIEKKPVRLGGYNTQNPELSRFERQIRYLNSLWGPNGEIIFYERVGTCCPFEVYGAPLDKGLLDVYALTWDGQDNPKHLYLDGYREGVVKIPYGLTTKIRPPVPPAPIP